MVYVDEIVDGCAALVYALQVPLMGVVSSAVAALDANLGIAEVASAGLAFLHDLAMAPENQVTP